MRLFKILLSVSVLCCTPTLAVAQYLDSPFSYNYLDLNYTTTMLTDNPAPDLLGYGARLSFDSPEGVRILLEWDETEESEAGINYRRRDIVGGVGFMSAQSDVTDMVLDLKYLRGEQDAGTNHLKANGYGIELGIRSLINEQIEFDLSGEFRSYFNSELGGRASLRYMFTPSMGIGVRYTYFQKTLTKLSAGLRFSI